MPWGVVITAGSELGQVGGANPDPGIFCLACVWYTGSVRDTNPLPRLILRRFGSVNAGFPSPAQGYEDEPLDLNEWLVRHPAATFFFRARGPHLAREGIRDGSLLVVDRSIQPTKGRLVVADQDGERVVCRLGNQPRGDVDAAPGDGLRVWGVVTAVIFKV